jgi:DNA modification methylase
MTLGTARVIRGNALALPLADESVDLICTSPPYWSLRQYTDGGAAYHGQIGGESTPTEFVDALIAATAEMARVLKPTGSAFVNLGDKYGPDKSLMDLPHRYAIRAVDELGLIKRAEICWAKPNGLPESVTDRVRRSHEMFFHLVRQPRYYSAVDEIREAYSPNKPWGTPSSKSAAAAMLTMYDEKRGKQQGLDAAVRTENPLGKLPGSVWEIPTQPLTVPDHLGVDHYACVDTDTEILTRRGWLRHDEVQAGDECAGYDLDAGMARWTTVHAVHRYPFSGDLVSVEKRDLSMRLTGNHRVIAQKRYGRTGARGATQVIRADELTPQHFIPRAATWQDGPATKAVGIDMAALLGWVAAEGWINFRRVMLSQSLTVNPAKVQQIDALVRRLGGDTYRTRQRTWRGRDWTDCIWSLPRDVSADVMRLLPGKRLTWDLLGLPEDERRALLDAFIAGDGHIRSDGRRSIYQHIDNVITVDVLQAIAVTLGYKTSRTCDGDRWVLYLTQGGRSVTLRGTNGTTEPIGRERYDGIVWCPTTGTGTFIARRNGRVFITGNSFPLEWPRRIIAGWSPPGICTACRQGRRPVAAKTGSHREGGYRADNNPLMRRPDETRTAIAASTLGMVSQFAITGYACACPAPLVDVEVTEFDYELGETITHTVQRPDPAWVKPAPTTPAVILDPFGGTGTTALAAKAAGRTGITIDMSADYCRLATWRCNDPRELASAMQVEKPERVMDGQASLFDGFQGEAS